MSFSDNITAFARHVGQLIDDLRDNKADTTDLTAIAASIPTTAADIGAQPAGSYVAPTDLAAVATSGAYPDLTGKPTIPTTAADVGAEPVGAVAGEVARADAAYAAKATQTTVDSGRLSSASLSATYVGPGVSVRVGADDAQIRAAAIALNASGGGTIMLPGETITLTSPLPLLSGVKYVGQEPDVTWADFTAGVWLPDNWDFAGGGGLRRQRNFRLLRGQRHRRSIGPPHLGRREHHPRRDRRRRHQRLLHLRHPRRS